eukprot:365655-Chlamydomonas_euryale.AAC.15
MQAAALAFWMVHTAAVSFFVYQAGGRWGSPLQVEAWASDNDASHRVRLRCDAFCHSLILCTQAVGMAAAMTYFCWHCGAGREGDDTDVAVCRSEPRTPRTLLVSGEPCSAPW